MRHVLTALGVVAATLIFPASTATACGLRGVDCPVPEVGGAGIGYHYDAETQVLHPNEFDVTGTETSTENGTSTTWETKYVRSCGSETTWRDGLAVSECANLGCEIDGERAYTTTVMRRASSSDPWETWPGRTNECMLGDDPDERPVPIQEIEIEITRIIEDHYRRIARPTIIIEPAEAGVVNLPVLAHAAQQGTVAFELTNPLPGRVEATPTYTWEWSNATTSTGPGRGYDGTNPSTVPGHYPVKATYTTAGAASVVLTATWDITLTLEGLPPITDIAPLVYDATERFTIRNARTVLVD